MPEILVIDDDLNIRNMLDKALTPKGYQVTLAIDGQEGLEAVRHSRPDLILLDLMMPRMDGYQVLDALQAEGSLRSIPVIILTALGQRSQIVEGLHKGANDYITKPFSLEELLARTSVQLRILELEHQVRQSEAYHRALFEHASDPELVLDGTGVILRVNEAATNLLELRQDQLLNGRIHDLISPADRREFEIAFLGSFEGSDIPIFEAHLALPEGKILPVDADLSSVEIQNQRHLLLHLRDIRRRKSAETRSAMIFEHIGDGVFITDHKGIVLLASRSAETLTSIPRDEIIGLDIAQFHSRESASDQQIMTALRENRAVVYEDILRQKGDREIPAEWTVAAFSVGSETYFIGVVRDLTDRRLADEKRMEADRLQTLLEIAGGAAHEINQPLTAILGYAEMAQSLLSEDHPAHDYQQHIVEATMRISNTLKQMQNIREYRTRPYTSGHKIVDFSRSSQEK